MQRVSPRHSLVYICIKLYQIAALNKYRPFLSPFEKTEIMRYPAIYYVGSHAKKHQASTDETAHNYGYDDDKGDYHIAIKDHLNYRYEIIESLGKGSFGQVVKCKDHKLQGDQSFVAVKIIRNKKRFHAQAQTEVRILEKLTKWVGFGLWKYAYLAYIRST